MRILAMMLTALLFQPAGADDHRTVVFVLFDGLAPDMINAADTPALDQIRIEGSWTHDMKPVFPTISTVNHTSYTTGCTTGDHGIVSNYFYNPEESDNPERRYFNGSRSADWRLGCETLWEVSERHGHPAAALGFAGHYTGDNIPTATHAPIEHSWQDSPDDPGRTDQIINLLSLPPATRPAVIAAYYKGPDWTAHWSGTTAPETLVATAAADTEVGRLMNAISAINNSSSAEEDSQQEVILFIAADHSMVDVETYFNIGRVMYKHDIEGKFASDGAHAFIYLDDENTADQAVKALNTYEMLSVYRRPHYPDYFDAGDSKRAGDILIVLDQPYWIADPSEFPDWANWLGLTMFWPEVISLSAGIKATHGYPPFSPNMGTSFYAWGPGIKRSNKLGEFNIIDAAPSALDWLGLPPGKKSSGQVRNSLFNQKKPGFSAPVQNVASQR